MAPTGLRVLTCQPHAITWRDDSELTLSPALAQRGDARSLRAAFFNFTWHLFDLHRLVPELRHDLAAAPERDQRGVVFYALRLTFRDADACVAHVLDIEDLVSDFTTVAPEPAHA